MRVPDEMWAILREAGGFSPELRARTEQVFAAIGPPPDVEALKSVLARAAVRLEAFARRLRCEQVWAVSLLPPASGEESVRAMEDRMLRQLWQQYRHLGYEGFCAKFHIARPSLYRRLNVRRG